MFIKFWCILNHPFAARGARTKSIPWDLWVEYNCLCIRNQFSNDIYNPLFYDFLAMELIMKFMRVPRNGVNHEIHVCVCCSTRLHRSGARSDIKEKPGDSCVVLYLDIVCVHVKVGELYVNGTWIFTNKGYNRPWASQLRFIIPLCNAVSSCRSRAAVLVHVTGSWAEQL